MNKLLAVALSFMFVAGCTSIDPATGQASRTNARTGALTGAVIGGLIGCATNNDECLENAAIGAAVGGAAGAGVGEMMRRQQLALQEELSGTGVGIQREGDNIRLIMPGDVTFSTASTDIDPSFGPVLNDVAAVFVMYPGTRVEITGHADSRGDEQYNLQLSHGRALSVGNHLISRGVAASRIFAYGAGEAQPVSTNDTEVGRARNRRVEILLIPANVS
jgi:outer membrane protein OmpA-like peptidoglycan-associated protein